MEQAKNPHPHNMAGIPLQMQNPQQQPIQQAVVVNNQVSQQEIEQQLYNYRSNQSCWKCVSIVFFIIFLILTISYAVSQFWPGAGGSFVNLSIWFFWYLSCKTGYESTLNRQFQNLYTSVNRMNISLYIQYACVLVNGGILGYFIYYYTATDNEFIKILLLYIGIIPMIILIIFMAFFLFMARTLRQRSHNLIFFLQQAGVLAKQDIEMHM